MGAQAVWGSASRDWGGWGIPRRQVGHQGLHMCPVLCPLASYATANKGMGTGCPLQHACQPHASAGVLCPSALTVPCPHRRGH